MLRSLLVLLVLFFSSVAYAQINLPNQSDDRDVQKIQKLIVTEDGQAISGSYDAASNLIMAIQHTPFLKAKQGTLNTHDDYIWIRK